MLTKLKHIQSNHEEGFTLTELIVVIVIIGILAAIAVPMYLNNRKQAIDVQTIANVENIANTVEPLFYEKSDSITKESYGNFNENVDTHPFDFKVNDGTLFIVGITDNGYCIIAYNESGGKHATRDSSIKFDSTQGGFTSNLNADCENKINNINTNTGSVCPDRYKVYFSSENVTVQGVGSVEYYSFSDYSYDMTYSNDNLSENSDIKIEIVQNGATLYRQDGDITRSNDDFGNITYNSFFRIDKDLKPEAWQSIITGTSSTVNIYLDNASSPTASFQLDVPNDLETSSDYCVYNVT